MSTGSERTDDRPTNTQYQVMLSGYRWFADRFPKLAGMVVLDAACGEGYGSNLLSEQGAEVTGIDYAREAIEHGERKYRRPNLIFRQMDAVRMDFADARFDAVISQDTIEHIPDDHAFIAETARVLKPGGTAVFFTPFAAEYNDRPANPYHVREYSPRALSTLLAERYRDIVLYGRTRGEELKALERTYDQVRRADVFSLRRFMPRGLRQRLAVLIACLRNGLRPEEVSLRHLVYAPLDERFPGTPDTLIAVCRR